MAGARTARQSVGLAERVRAVFTGWTHRQYTRRLPLRGSRDFRLCARSTPLSEYRASRHRPSSSRSPVSQIRSPHWPHSLIRVPLSIALSGRKRCRFHRPARQECVLRNRLHISVAHISLPYHTNALPTTHTPAAMITSQSRQPNPSHLITPTGTTLLVRFVHA